MKLAFKVGEEQLEFERNWFTGRVDVRRAGRSVTIDSPYDPRAHFSVSLKRQWRFEMDGHSVVIEKTRAIWFAGFRPQSYRVLVDGTEVLATRGY